MKLSEWFESTGLQVPDSLRAEMDRVTILAEDDEPRADTPRKDTSGMSKQELETYIAELDAAAAQDRTVEIDASELQHLHRFLQKKAWEYRAIAYASQDDEVKAAEPQAQFEFFKAIKEDITVKFYGEKLPGELTDFLRANCASAVSLASKTHLEEEEDWRQACRDCGVAEMPLVVAHSDLPAAQQLVVFLEGKTGAESQGHYGVATSYMLETLPSKLRQALFRHEIQLLLDYGKLTRSQHEARREDSVLLHSDERAADDGGGRKGEKSLEMAGTLLRIDARTRELAPVTRFLEAVYFCNYFQSVPPAVAEWEMNSPESPHSADMRQVPEEIRNNPQKLVGFVVGTETDSFSQDSHSHPSTEGRVNRLWTQHVEHQRKNLESKSVTQP